MKNKSFKDFVNENKKLKTEADENEVVDTPSEETENDGGDLHTKWIEFLKSQIEEYCVDGYYQIYWDYSEEFSADQVKRFTELALDDGDMLPVNYAVDELWEYNADYENNFFDEIEKNIPDELREYAEERDLMEDLEEAGYNGLDVNAAELWDRAEVKVNIIFATPSEQNYDMGSIVNCYGSWHEPNYANLEISDLDNGMTYTINQQGHSAKEYYDCYLKNPGGFGLDHKSTFIESCVDDCVNNSSDYMSAMCVLTRLSAEDYYQLMKAVKSEEGAVTFSANSYCGTVNIWAGSGGLSLNLEKPLTIPTSYIHTVQVEGASENNGYTVDEIFGLVGECWNGEMTFGGEVATLENLDELLSYIKSIAPKSEEDEE